MSSPLELVGEVTRQALPVSQRQGLQAGRESETEGVSVLTEQVNVTCVCHHVCVCVCVITCVCVCHHVCVCVCLCLNKKQEWDDTNEVHPDP